MSEIACGSGSRVFRRRLRLAGYFRTLPFWRCTLRGCPRTFRRPNPSFGRVLQHGNLLAVPAIGKARRLRRERQQLSFLRHRRLSIRHVSISKTGGLIKINYL